MTRRRLLDLFCCQGGASRGYADAGFEVVGVDIDPQPRYPFEFVQADALEYLAEHGNGGDAVHASPPCQAHTKAGCAPRECREGSLICDRCFGRMRALLADGPDLIGRVRSLADPMKATPTDKAPGGRVSASEPPAPVDADLLDALCALERLEPWWHVTLSDYSNDLDMVTWLGEVVLDKHPEVEGLREAWSVADAMAKWGAERRTDTFIYPDDEDDYETEAAPVREWFDPLLTLQQAAHRAKVTQRQVQRWVQREHLTVVAQHRGPRGSVMKYVHASAVDSVIAQMKMNQEGSRFGVTLPR